MAKRAISSAPGKLMLFGEHAVVYGYPCIVTAVNTRMRVKVNSNDKQDIVIHAPQMDPEKYVKAIKDLGKLPIPRNIHFIEVLINNTFKKYHLKEGLNIYTNCDFSAHYGFGSSAAVTVALAKSIDELFLKKLKRKELFNLCYQTILEVQGIGSGFDVASAIYGGTLYFIKGGKIIEHIRLKKLPTVVIGYTGKKADTATMVRKVADFRKIKKRQVDFAFERISEIVKQARNALKEGNYLLLGRLMDDNQKLLKELGVSSRELDRLILAAKKAGAMGAKLSGAGGGDCMIALVEADKKETVEEAISRAGGKIINVTLNAEGIRRERNLKAEKGELC